MPWFIVLFAYLIGAVPTGYIAGRLATGKDIRHMGDANMGAANVYRQVGARIGLAVFFLDAAKGAIAIFIARLANVSELTTMFAGVAAVAGHNWPLFIGFRGGRGESTAIGILTMLMTQPMLILGGPALAVLIIFKNVILASAVLFIPLPLLCWWAGDSGLLILYSIAVPCLIGFTHYIRTRQPAQG